MANDKLESGTMPPAAQEALAKYRAEKGKPAKETQPDKDAQDASGQGDKSTPKNLDYSKVESNINDWMQKQGIKMSKDSAPFEYMYEFYGSDGDVDYECLLEVTDDNQYKLTVNFTQGDQMESSEVDWTDFTDEDDLIKQINNNLDDLIGTTDGEQESDNAEPTNVFKNPKIAIRRQLQANLIAKVNLKMKLQAGAEMEDDIYNLVTGKYANGFDRIWSMDVRGGINSWKPLINKIFNNLNIASPLDDNDLTDTLGWMWDTDEMIPTDEDTGEAYSDDDIKRFFAQDLKEYVISHES